MLESTIQYLLCPSCSGALRFNSKNKSQVSQSLAPAEIRSGQLVCKKCSAQFLILAGVAILVEDTFDYLTTHVKGISKVVSDQEIPPEFRDDFREAKAEIAPEHIEEDLEAERVNALYLMNHYLRADSKPEWWKPLTDDGQSTDGSPLIDRLIRESWDHGPFAHIRAWVSDLSQGTHIKSALELGCGVGGLHAVLKPFCDFYLGVDSSFASIALARHIALGVQYPYPLRIPGDLLQGGLSREIHIPVPTSFEGRTDFVVSEVQNPAITSGWDLTLSLNMIDMLDSPEELPLLQSNLLENNGVAIQSCPYIWHEAVAENLRDKIPREFHGDSARAVEWLYREAGFEIEKSVDHVPWLFFKQVRQLEIYSTHLFLARKKSSSQVGGPGL